MTTDRTFTIIKPEAVAAGKAMQILEAIVFSGFKFTALKMKRLSAEEASQFYAVHRERPFYSELVAYMSSGPVYVGVLQKENAVRDFRTLIGATDPAEAAQGTIRKKFGQSKAENAIHGSDSDENAAVESAFFFRPDEIIH